MPEKLQILNMVSEGKISAEEGMELLSALDEPKQDGRDRQKRRSLRVKIHGPSEDAKVNATIPISLIRLGFKLASKLSPEFREAGLAEIDLEEIIEAIDDGAVGTIVEVDADDGTKIEVIAE
ncbi:MAG TPA: hypothetical protein VK031_01795 [Tissierellaceae bacterium]|nr:hypothetical protein [Tissierellaceae bacterium]